MKLAFTFTNLADLSSLPSEDIYNSYFEIPDDVRNLIGFEERILAIAAAISQFTQAALHLTCTDLGIKNLRIKPASSPGARPLSGDTIVTIVHFERTNGYRSQSRQIKVYLPIEPVVPRLYLVPQGRRKRQRSLRSNLLQIGTWWCKTDEQLAYAATMSSLVDQLLMLLNAEPAASPGQGWICQGFHPWWSDDALIKRHSERFKRQAAEARKRQKEDERRQAREAKMPERALSALQVPRTGAGRRPGARPGKFMGVQMRSQLEIRFAAELQERNIEWVYEGEVLGEGGYLVDFYLPMLGCWVEVKGQFEPRDNYLLKEVSELLKRERQQRLFVYAQSKAFVVSPTEFREISHDAFWNMLFQ